MALIFQAMSLLGTKTDKDSPAFTKTANTQNGTTSWAFPTFGTGPAFPEHLQVFVIRRDLKNGIFVYNRNGDLIAFSAPVTGSVTKRNKPQNRRRPCH